jgi:hypothetical protein
VKEDPIVDEVRRAGEKYLAQFDFNMKAACDDLRRRTEEARRAGRQVVSFPPRLITPQKIRGKKAG